MALIRVRSKPDGSVEIETEGFQGPACKAATAPLEKLLGLPTSDTDKPEMYETGPATGTQQQGLTQ